MQEQKVENYPNWQTDLYNCDFAEYARNCSELGIKLVDPIKLDSSIKKALSSGTPGIVDIDTDPRRFVRS